MRAKWIVYKILKYSYWLSEIIFRGRRTSFKILFGIDLEKALYFILSYVIVVQVYIFIHNLRLLLPDQKGGIDLLDRSNYLLREESAPNPARNPSKSVKFPINSTNCPPTPMDRYLGRDPDPALLAGFQYFRWGSRPKAEQEEAHPLG